MRTRPPPTRRGEEPQAPSQRLRLAVSSTAFRSLPLPEAIAEAAQSGLTLEFSSGIPHRHDLVTLFREAACQRLIHNYFPAPARAFVLNLASQDPEVLGRSRAHASRGLALAAEVGAPFYSVHAGFCVDPDVSDLGGSLPPADRRARGRQWATFVESIRLLAQDAAEFGADLLVENNVVSAGNGAPGQEPPLFCADDRELLRLLREVDAPSLGLLLDTGHLKVSSRTLGRSRSECVDRIAEHVRAVHHSDNDGLADTNHPLGEGYWFLDFMPRLREALHVIEVHDQPVPEVLRQQQLLEDAAGRGCT